MGRLVSATGPEGRVSGCRCDPAGRLLERLDPEGETAERRESTGNGLHAAVIGSDHRKP